MSRPFDRRRWRNRLLAAASVVVAAALAVAVILRLEGASWWAALGAASIGPIIAGVILHRPGGVPILVYHSVSPDASWLPWAANTSIRPQTFERHLLVLKRRGWTVISSSSLIRARANAVPLARQTAVLHFDDGYLDNLLFAVPLLRAFDMPATFFASTDFIDPSAKPRVLAPGAGPSTWRGYMNGAELRALDADPLFEVEAHGADHALVPVSDRVVDHVTAGNWRRHAPLGWSDDAGDKSRWYEAAAPSGRLALGATVPETDSALAGRWWRDGMRETDAAFAARVSATLRRTHDQLGQVLGRAPTILAWPFDRCCAISVAAAFDAGFHAVTGGRGLNRAGEDPTVLSRVHVQDRAFGGGPLWLEGLAFEARLNAASGRLAWWPVAALATGLRRLRSTGVGPLGA